MLVVGLAFWLGVTLGEMVVSIENNAKAIERLEDGLERLEIKVEHGQERIENLLIDILRQRNGSDG